MRSRYTQGTDSSEFNNGPKSHTGSDGSGSTSVESPEPGEGTLEEDNPTMSGLPGTQLRHVTEFIDDNLARALPLAELSAEAHLSQYHFARLFKEATGLPPHRFVVQRRIARACALLLEGNLSIDAIARAVGFRTRSHFSMVFHRHTGSPPTVYRAFAGLRKSNGDVHDQAGEDRQMM